MIRLFKPLIVFAILVTASILWAKGVYYYAGETVAGSTDLYDSANCLAVTGEADATTDIDQHSSPPTFESQGVTVDDGSYALKTEADSGGDGFIIDLNNYISATDNVLVRYRVRHTGSGGTWECGVDDDAYCDLDQSTETTILVGDTAFFSDSYEIASYGASDRYFCCRENSPGDDGGIYFDKFEIIDPAP